MLEALTIRPVRSGDLQGLIALLNGARTGRQSSHSRLPEAIRQRIAGNLNVLRLVAVCDDAIIGQVSLNRVACIGRLTIAVREDCQARGVGTAMLKEILNAGVKRGLTRIELDVLGDNLPALALYRKFGFKLEAKNFDRNGHEIFRMAIRVAAHLDDRHALT